MRIGIVTTAIFREECALGISNTVNLISRYIVKKYDAEITVFTPEVRGYPSIEEFGGFGVERFPFKRFMTDWTISPAMFSEIKKKDLDIIHSFHYGYFPATAGFLTAKAKNIPHIFTTSYHPSQSSAKKRFLMKIYNATQGRFILQFSDKVFPQNIVELNHLKKIANFDYELVPCPLNDNIFYPRRIKKEKIVLYVGAMLPWKGAEIAFNVCKEIEREDNEARFVFIGGGPLKTSLMNQASKRFTFLENVSTTELSKWFNRASLLLSPTKYESFGRAVAEALMCGTPVMSTKVGAIPETVGPGGFLVDYEDWGEMKNYVSMLLNDEKMLKKMGIAATKHAERYKHGVVAGKIFNVYEEVLR